MPKIRLKLNDINNLPSIHGNANEELHTEENRNNVDYSGMVLSEEIRELLGKKANDEDNYTIDKSKKGQNDRGSDSNQTTGKIIDNSAAIEVLQKINPNDLSILVKKLIDANEDLLGFHVKMIDKIENAYANVVGAKNDIIGYVNNKKNLPNYWFLKENNDYLYYANLLSSMYDQLGDLVDQIEGVNKKYLKYINISYEKYLNLIKTINKNFYKFTEDQDLSKVKLLDKKPKKDREEKKEKFNSKFNHDLKLMKKELLNNQYISMCNDIQELFKQNNLDSNTKVNFKDLSKVDDSKILLFTNSPDAIMSDRANKISNSNLIMSNLSEIQRGLDTYYAQVAALAVLKANGINANNTSQIGATVDSLTIYCEDYDEAKKVYAALKKYFLVYYVIFFDSKSTDHNYIRSLLTLKSNRNLRQSLGKHYKEYVKIISSLQDQLLIYITYEKYNDEQDYIVKIANTIASDEFYSDVASSNDELNSDPKTKTLREYEIKDSYIDLIINDLIAQKENHADWANKVLNKINTDRLNDLVASAKELTQPADDAEIKVEGEYGTEDEEVEDDEDSN